MTIQQLEYILALDKYRHFVKAAESCFISQPTLTLQIQKLENEIGIMIFDRSQQPIKVTPLGKIFISKAKEIVFQISNLKDIVKNDKKTLSGVVKLGIIPTLAPYLLPLFLKPFTENNPNLFLEIEELESENIIQKLNEESIDIGIMATPIKEKKLKEILLFQEPFLAYVNERDPLYKNKEISREDLNTDRLWLLKEGHCFREQILDICSKDERTKSNNNYSFESGSIETLKNLVKMSKGYTLIPKLSINYLDKPYIRDFKDYFPVRDISIVINKNFSKELILNNLRKEIIDKLPSDFKKNEYFQTIEWR